MLFDSCLRSSPKNIGGEPLRRPGPRSSSSPTPARKLVEFSTVEDLGRKCNRKGLPADTIVLPAKQATSIRSIKSLVPLLDRVLVQRIKADTKTASGIFLPESSVKELNEAKVLAVGPGALDKEGKRLPVGVQAGDRVLIPTVRRPPGPLVESGRLFRFLENVRPGSGMRDSVADKVVSSLAAPPSRLARTSTLCSGTASKFAPIQPACLVFWERVKNSDLSAQDPGQDQRVKRRKRYPRSRRPYNDL